MCVLFQFPRFNVIFEIYPYFHSNKYTIYISDVLLSEWYFWYTYTWYIERCQKYHRWIYRCVVSIYISYILCADECYIRHVFIIFSQCGLLHDTPLTPLSIFLPAWYMITDLSAITQPYHTPLRNDSLQVPPIQINDKPFRRYCVRVTKPIFSVPLFFRVFAIIQTLVTYWISRLYLTGIVAAQALVTPVKYESDWRRNWYFVK